MNERRNKPRQRLLKAGMISFARAAGIDCVVRNMSASGACLEVASPLGIPDTFSLVVAKDGFNKPCRIIWRSAKRIGVSFT